MTAIFAYARVSTTEQTTDNQFLEIEQAGFNVPADFRFCDVGVSGSVPAKSRPAFQKMLGKIRRGETLVVTKLDRLGRDSVDVQQTIRALDEMGVKVIVLQFGQTDLTSAAGKLIVTVLAAVAEMERDLTIERTMAGLARARSEGRVGGRPRGTSEDQRQQIQAKIDAGMSEAAVAREMGLGRAAVRSALGKVPLREKAQ